MESLRGTVAYLYLLPATLLMSVGEGHAEVWLCAGSAGTFYTNTPTVSIEQRCQPAVFGASGYTRLEGKSFDSFAQLFAPDVQPARRRPEDTRPQAGSFAKTSLKAKEVNTKGRGRPARGLNVGCELSGQARSEKNMQAQIKITRGALTVDTVSIVLPGDMKPVEWSVLLTGRCRNPRAVVLESRRGGSPT